jgi:hypothetical protein
MIMRSSVLLLGLVAVISLFGLQFLGPPYPCTSPSPAIKNVTIMYNPAGITVAPPTQHARQGDVIRFNLFGTAGTMVAVQGKNSAASWINESGNNIFFYECVDEEQAPGDYEYRVEAYGSPSLDPVFVIHKL